MSTVNGTGLCKIYGCIPYNPNNLCQCNFECLNNNTCCTDFEFECEGLNGFEHEELLAQNEYAIISDMIGVICFIAILIILIFGCRIVNIYINKPEPNEGNVNDDNDIDYDNENDNDNESNSPGIEINKNILSGSEKPIIYTALASVTSYMFSLLAYSFANISNSNESFLINQMASFVFWSVGYIILYLNLFLHYHYIVQESRILDVSLQTRKNIKDAVIHALFIIITLSSLISWVIFFLEFAKSKWDNKKIYRSIVFGIFCHIFYTIFITILYIQQTHTLMLSRTSMLISLDINKQNAEQNINHITNNGPNDTKNNDIKNNAKQMNINKITRITVLRLIGTISTVILIILWSLLFIEEDKYEGEGHKVSGILWNFAWWLFPIDSVLNSINVLFSATLFDKYYLKICCICHRCFNKCCANITELCISKKSRNQPIHDMDNLR